MKKNWMIVALMAVGVAAWAEPRVVRDVVLGHGWDPQLSADGKVVTYIPQDADHYAVDPGSRFEAEGLDMELTTPDLRLCLTRNGKSTFLTPDGEDAHYIWTSFSPDGQYILYNTAYGTSVCDLEGKVVYRLGHLNAPVWYGMDYVVGVHGVSDGHDYTASAIVLHCLATGEETTLTSPEVLAMYPTVNARSGRVVYTTIGGDIRMLQLNLTDEPISYADPELREANTKMLAPRKVRTKWEKPEDVKIYINPGHGGYTSNDRNMKIYPFKSGDTLGFWESQSNLDKGFALRDWLKGLGMQTMMSRTLNREVDDRDLSAIVKEANAYDADFMVSIHSNAGGPSNYVLELYAGKDANDTYTYPTPTPVSNESRAISTLIGNNHMQNVLTPWSVASAMIRGDKTFGRTAMHWSDGYGVLRRLVVPGVIHEGSMHDYIPETYRLMNIDYKRKEAFYLMKSFLTYFLKTQVPWGAIGGQVRDAYNKQLFPEITRRANTLDVLDPLCGATIDLLQNDSVIDSYTTDALYNGIYFFWNLDPGTYVVRTHYSGYYDRNDTVQVVAGDIAYNQSLMQMQRSTRPEVVSFSPNVQLTDSQEVTVNIVLNFNWDMVEEATEKAFHITPEAAGKFTWSNSQKTLTFKPTEGFEKGTEYTVVLDTTACHPDSTFANHLKENFTLKFRTKNRDHLSVIQTYPANGAVDVPLQPTIYALFDLELASTTLSTVATLSEAGGDTYTPARSVFKKNTAPSPYGNIRFDVTKELKANTTYTLTISGTTKDINKIAMGKDYSITFTTGNGEGEKEGEVLETMDKACLTANYDKSDGVKSKSITSDKVSKTEGSASNRITYQFDPDLAEAKLFLTPSEVGHQFTSNSILYLDVYGDFSGNRVEAELSTDGDMRMIPIATLDYVGWKHFAIPCTDLPEKVTFQWTGLLIRRQEGILSAAGDVYVDRLARKNEEPSAVEEVTSSATATKQVINGQLYIVKDGRLYTVHGSQCTDSVHGSQCTMHGE